MRPCRSTQRSFGEFKRLPAKPIGHNRSLAAADIPAGDAASAAVGTVAGQQAAVAVECQPVGLASLGGEQGGRSGAGIVAMDHRLLGRAERQIGKIDAAIGCGGRSFGQSAVEFWRSARRSARAGASGGKIGLSGGSGAAAKTRPAVAGKNAKQAARIAKLVGTRIQRRIRELAEAGGSGRIMATRLCNTIGSCILNGLGVQPQTPCFGGSGSSPLGPFVTSDSMKEISQQDADRP